jgi:hypothetical protein
LAWPRAGWRETSAPFGEEGGFRSIADITDVSTRDRVREYKKQMKAAAKARAG